MPKKTTTEPTKTLKVTPEQHERLKAIGFQKGQSGNPAGKPPTPKELKVAAAHLSMDSLETLRYLRDNSPNDMVRLQAASRLLSYNVSAAATEQKVDVNVTTSPASWLARANSRQTVIEAAPEDIQTIEDDSDSLH